MNCQIKVLETWKSLNIQNYPIKFEKSLPCGDRATRGNSNGNLKEIGKINLTQNSFHGDASRLWNSIPESIKSCKTVHSVKTAIKKFVTTLPV